jgi:hypothetical protein
VNRYNKERAGRTVKGEGRKGEGNSESIKE